MNTVELSFIRDNDLVEIYINGWFACSPHINDISPEAQYEIGLIEIQD